MVRRNKDIVTAKTAQSSTAALNGIKLDNSSLFS